MLQLRRSQSLAAAGLALVFGFGSREFRNFERAAARDIASKLSGPNKRVDVRAHSNGLLGAALGDFDHVDVVASDFTADGLPLFTEPNRNRRGITRNLRLLLTNFAVNGLDVERLEATIPNCRFDLPLALRNKRIRLSVSGIGRGEVVIDDRALERFVLAKFNEIRSVRITSDRGWVWIEGEGEFLVVQTKFRVLAKLVPIDGSKLMLHRARISFDDLPVAPEVAEATLATLNPVIDLNADLGLHSAISLEGVETTNGKLRAWGAATIPILPTELK